MLFPYLLQVELRENVKPVANLEDEEELHFESHFHVIQRVVEPQGREAGDAFISAIKNYLMTRIVTKVCFNLSLF